MTTSDITNDPTLYKLFERIVREAPPATEYRVEMTGTRANGSTFKYDRRLSETEKDQLPWGTHDAIIDVTWTAPNEYGLRGDEFVKIHVDGYNRGIGVVTTFEHPGQLAICLATSEHTDDRGQFALHYFPNEDGVVAKVLESIQIAVDEANANRRGSGSFCDYEYDEDRDDPLNELSTPAQWR